MVYSTRSFQLTRLSYHCPGPMHLDSVTHEIVGSPPPRSEGDEGKADTYPKLQLHGSYGANSYQIAREKLKLSPQADKIQNQLALYCGFIQGQGPVSGAAAMRRTSSQQWLRCAELALSPSSLFRVWFRTRCYFGDKAPEMSQGRRHPGVISCFLTEQRSHARAATGQEAERGLWGVLPPNTSRVMQPGASLSSLAKSATACLTPPSRERQPRRAPAPPAPAPAAQRKFRVSADLFRGPLPILPHTHTHPTPLGK